MMLRTMFGMLLAAALAGCSGRYIITVPDVATTGGKPTAVVTRLQRQEFWSFAPPVADAVVVVGVEGLDLRAGYTDRKGYAAVSVPTPQRPGRYPVSFYHQDERGDEAVGVGACYVLEPDRLVVAVDWETVEDDDDAALAAPALQKLVAAGVQVVYARRRLDSPAADKAHLSRWGLPEGPMLSWGYKRKWGRKIGDPVGSLPAAREAVAGLLIVLWAEDDLARAAEAMKMVALPVDDWSASAGRILAATELTKAQDFSLLTPEAVRELLNLDD